MRRIVLVAVVALAFPAVASAHATLRSTTPSFRSELKQGPKVIRLTFDQQVKVLPGSIRVLNGVGKNFAGPARAEGTDVVATVRHLKLGGHLLDPDGCHAAPVPMSLWPEPTRDPDAAATRLKPPPG